MVKDGAVGGTRRGQQLVQRLAGECRLKQPDRDSRRDLASGRTTHPVGHRDEIVAAEHAVFVAFPDPADVGPSIALETGHSLPPFSRIGGEHVPRVGQRIAPLGRLDFDEACPLVKPVRRAGVQDRSDLADGHARPAEPVDQAGVVELAGGVVAVSGSGVDRRRNEQAAGGVAPQSLGGQAR